MRPISWPGLLRYVPWLLMTVCSVGPLAGLLYSQCCLMPCYLPFHRLLVMSSSDWVGEILEELNPGWIAKFSDLLTTPFSVLPVHCLHTCWDVLVFIFCFAVQVST